MIEEVLLMEQSRWILMAFYTIESTKEISDKNMSRHIFEVYGDYALKAEHYVFNSVEIKLNKKLIIIKSCRYKL